MIGIQWCGPYSIFMLNMRCVFAELGARDGDGRGVSEGVVLMVQDVSLRPCGAPLDMTMWVGRLPTGGATKRRPLWGASDGRAVWGATKRRPLWGAADWRAVWGGADWLAVWGGAGCWAADWGVGYLANWCIFLAFILMRGWMVLPDGAGFSGLRLRRSLRWLGLRGNNWGLLGWATCRLICCSSGMGLGFLPV